MRTYHRGMGQGGIGRHSGDSWDLSSGVGITATGSALGRAIATRGPHPLIDDPYAEAIVRAVGVAEINAVLDGPQDPEAEAISQSIAELNAVRTIFYDEFLATACDAGLRQIVIIASGLDTRGYRLVWPSGTTVFEVDEPNVLEFKRSVLDGAGAEPSARLHRVAVDLRDDWLTALLSDSFDPKHPTAWIAEGLLPYLPPQAQRLMFDRVTTLSAPGSRLATENVTDLEGFAGDRGRVHSRRWSRVGVTVDFSELMYLGPRKTAAEELARRGWQVRTVTMADRYAAGALDLPDTANAVVPPYEWASATR